MQHFSEAACTLSDSDVYKGPGHGLVLNAVKALYTSLSVYQKGS